jgi:hypothetical protein
MTDYYRYKECMDEARKLTIEADALMEKGGARNATKQQKCAALLAKATLLRKLAMEYAFGGPRKPRFEGDDVVPSEQEPVMAAHENGKLH